MAENGLDPADVRRPGRPACGRGERAVVADHAQAGAHVVPRSRSPRRLRVFLALWPDADTAAVLHAHGRALQAACGGRLMRRDTVHLTLAFIGEVEADAVARIQAIAAQVQGARFELVLDRVGSWHGHRIVWAGASSTPAPLAALAQALDAKLRTAGFELEARAFFPHVTLVRNARSTPEPDGVQAVRWAVDSFVLVCSERLASGAHYRVLGRWPLA